MSYKLVIAEKPSVAQFIAKVIGADKREDGYLEGNGFTRITTHASITAKPFFLHRGYKLVNEQQVVRKGIYLTNYAMEK